VELLGEHHANNQAEGQAHQRTVAQMLNERGGLLRQSRRRSDAFLSVMRTVVRSHNE